MKQLTKEQRCAVIRCLVDGCSIRATVRITGVSKNTIQKLTRELGEACLEFQDQVFRKLTCKRVQCDEIWNFCYCKRQERTRRNAWRARRRSDVDLDRHVRRHQADFRWQLGSRDAANAYRFMRDRCRIGWPIASS